MALKDLVLTQKVPLVQLLAAPEVSSGPGIEKQFMDEPQYTIFQEQYIE